MNYYETILDSDWLYLPQALGPATIPLYRKRFGRLQEAEALRDTYLEKVCTEQGALFVHQPPMKAYTPMEAAEAAIRGERNEIYADVFLVPQITFEQLLGFLDAFAFAAEIAGRKSVNRPPKVVREEAKSLLRAMSDVSQLTFTSIATSHLSGRFLERVADLDYKRLMEQVFDFNDRYYLAVKSRSHLLRNWKANYFFKFVAS